MNKRLEGIDTVVNTQEKYSRQNCLLIHGREEENNKNTYQSVIDMLHEFMGRTMSLQDIDQSNRLPCKKSNKKSWPVIAKFTRYNTRDIKNLKIQKLV